MSASQLTPFLASLHKHSFGTDVRLLVRHQDIKKLTSLKQRYPSVSFQPTLSRFPRSKLGRDFLVKLLQKVKRLGFTYNSDTAQCLSALTIHIALRRYLIAERILNQHKNPTDMVMLADSRDIVFQGNPFTEKCNSIVCGLESKTISECPSNSSWIRNLYGLDIHSQLSGKPIACSGLTVGPLLEIKTYLKKMNQEIWLNAEKIAFECGYDQGIHNYLINSDHGALSMRVTGNSDGFIATLGHEDPDNISINPSTKAIEVCGTPPAIVHQYDRHLHLQTHVSMNYQ